MPETLRAQLNVLYHAGKVTFPERAATIAAALDTIAAVHGDWAAPTLRAGSPAALTKAMDINATVHDLLRRAVLSWQDAASALVAIADDLVATDGDAAALVAKPGFRLDELEMPALPTPPTLAEHGS